VGGVHLRELRPDNTTPLRDYLGGSAKGIEGYPFHELTQVHKYTRRDREQLEALHRRVREFYHAPILHGEAVEADESPEGRRLRLRGARIRARRSALRMVSSWGACRAAKDESMVKPIERVLRSGLFGPWDAPDIGSTSFRPAQPGAPQALGLRLVRLLPELHELLIWKPNWVLTYHYWPTSLQHAHLRGDLLLRAAEERARAPAAGARGGVVQGVRLQGRQHARGDADDARIEHSREVSSR
jgi:hypothetical protein